MPNDFDHEAARREGWSLATGHSSIPGLPDFVAIVRLPIPEADEMGFETDEDAVEYVVAEALLGSPLHQHAVRLTAKYQEAFEKIQRQNREEKMSNNIDSTKHESEIVLLAQNDDTRLSFLASEFVAAQEVKPIGCVLYIRGINHSFFSTDNFDVVMRKIECAGGGSVFSRRSSVG